jgi:hypothetical protein
VVFRALSLAAFFSQPDDDRRYPGAVVHGNVRAMPRSTPDRDDPGGLSILAYPWKAAVYLFVIR